VPTPEFQRFLDSMVIGYMQWHDGEGYDLETLAALSPEERASAETVLITHLDLAEGHPTPRVKRALLDCARLGAPTTRVNAAALLMYLCGKAEEPFDWNQRPFFLRFQTEDNQELRAAWMELRERTGI
jgi:hypothetical protein